MGSARYIVGDSLTVLRSLPDASVDLVMSSPPFLALRSYLPSDHPDKALEIGSEATPGEFLDVLLDIVVECRRVLAPHGSLVFELGDTYSGSGGAGGDYNEGGLRDGQAAFDGSAARAKRSGDEPRALRERTNRPGSGWPLAKCLTLIPQSFAWALAYGRNPWTGREIEPWRVRNVRPWLRTNPPVGALGGKWRPGSSYSTVACIAVRNYFDEQAIREDSDLVDWFVDNGGGYDGAHFAVFPPTVPLRFVRALTPPNVCRTCGAPSTRIVERSERSERSERYAAAREAIGDFNQRGREGNGVSGSRSVLNAAAGADITGAEYETIGWSDCGHDNARPGCVLDPFAGTGTTLMVATGHGRDAIGIDLDERNAELALQRVGPLLLGVERFYPAETGNIPGDEASGWTSESKGTAPVVT